MEWLENMPVASFHQYATLCTSQITYHHINNLHMHAMYIYNTFLLYTCTTAPPTSCSYIIHSYFLEGEGDCIFTETMTLSHYKAIIIYTGVMHVKH